MKRVLLALVSLTFIVVQLSEGSEYADKQQQLRDHQLKKSSPTAESRAKVLANQYGRKAEDADRETSRWEIPNDQAAEVFEIAAYDAGATSPIIVETTYDAYESYRADSPAARKQSIEIGTEISYFKYKEPGVMQEKGIMYGIFADYTMHSGSPVALESFGDIIDQYINNYYFGIDGLFKYGQVDYSSGSTGSIDNINDFMFEITGKAGYEIALNENTVLVPYTGVGYRYLNDDSGGKLSTTGAAGYERESNYVYIPFGFETNTLLADGWSWGFGAEYDLFVGGKQKSHLEDVSSSLSTVENDQDSGYGVRGSIKIAKQSEKINWMVEPFVRYWNVDNSSTAVVTCGGTPCAVGYEPANESLDYGVRIGGAF